VAEEATDARILPRQLQPGQSHLHHLTQLHPPQLQTTVWLRIGSPLPTLEKQTPSPTAHAPCTLHPPITNTGFHNLCTHKQPPLGIKQLLGYNLKFCIQIPLPDPDIQASIQCLRASVRTSFATANFDFCPNAATDYNHKLYWRLRQHL